MNVQALALLCYFYRIRAIDIADMAASDSLTRRERQIMNALYRLGRATAGQIRARLDDAPSYSTVRTQLRVLEEKGHVRHEDEGLRYVYVPTVTRAAARRTALRHVVDTFFDGSTAHVVTTLLGSDASKLTDEDLDRIAAIVEQARKENR